MKKPTVVSLATRAALLGFAVLSLGSPAEAQTKPINIALVTPIQIVPPEVAVSGFRWNIIYGKNSAMTGLDIGIANHVAGPMKGVQWGIVNLTESMVGWQDGFVNYTTGEFEGLQWGGVNYAGRINGLQLGIVNYAERANGVQVGLINIIKEGGMFPVMIIANWGFEQARQ
ncbi:LA_2272/LA_2273 family lipoprotein [Gemmatimonadota bacterium]